MIKIIHEGTVIECSTIEEAWRMLDYIQKQQDSAANEPVKRDPRTDAAPNISPRPRAQ